MATKMDAFQSEDLECPVCLLPEIEPIALACGHSCCRLCLVRATRLSVNGRSCPLCRTLISIKNIYEEPSDARRVEAVRQHLGSEAYDERLNENLEELAEINRRANLELPIFAMHPGTQVGGRVMLHLFEPRYKLLVRRCWEGNHLFVYCGSAPRAGGTGHVVRILEGASQQDSNLRLKPSPPLPTEECTFEHRSGSSLPTGRSCQHCRRGT